MNALAHLMLAQGVPSGCGIVLPTAWDDNFDCGTALDTTGARFSGANAWTVYGAGGIRDLVNITGTPELRIASTTGGVRSADGARQTLPAYVPASSAGDFSFEVTVRTLDGFFDSGVGLLLYELATGKNLYLLIGADFTAPGGFYDFNARVVVGTALFPTRYGRTVIASLDGTVRISRAGATLSYAFKQGAGAWTTIYTAAQTADFTTAPDLIGPVNFVGPGGPETGYFSAFKRTV